MCVLACTRQGCACVCPGMCQGCARAHRSARICLRLCVHRSAQGACARACTEPTHVPLPTAGPGTEWGPTVSPQRVTCPSAGARLAWSILPAPGHRAEADGAGPAPGAAAEPGTAGPPVPAPLPFRGVAVPGHEPLPGRARPDTCRNSNVICPLTMGSLRFIFNYNVRPNLDSPLFINNAWVCVYRCLINLCLPQLKACKIPKGGGGERLRRASASWCWRDRRAGVVAVVAWSWWRLAAAGAAAERAVPPTPAPAPHILGGLPMPGGARPSPR